MLSDDFFQSGCQFDLLGDYLYTPPIQDKLLCEALRRRIKVCSLVIGIL